MTIILGILLLILTISTIVGIKHGVVRRVIEILGLVLIFLFASRVADVIEPSLSDAFDIDPGATFFIAWAVVLIGGILLVRLIAIGMGKLFRLSILGWLDRIGGAVLGLAFGAIVCSCLLIGLLALPVSKQLRRDIQDHPVTSSLLHVAPSLYDIVAQSWDGEGFFEMVEKRIGPLAEDAVEGIRAFVTERQKEDEEDR